MPESEPSRSGIVSGTLPSSGTSISSASSCPPPSPKSWKRSPPGVVKPDMFSITPAISSLTLSAICAERRATFCAVGCGVVTMMNFACGSSPASVIETSPVPGRQVDQQVVELAPRDVLEELRERLVEHRAAPHDRLVLVEEEADRHDLEAVRLEREDLALRRHLRPLGAEAEHARDRVAPHVGVEHADLLALRGERAGEVDGQRRLADAALAGADAEDVGDLGERAFGQPAGAAELALQAGLLLVGEHVEADVDRADALDAAHGVGDSGLEVVLDRAAWGRERDGDVDGPAVLDLDRADHVELDDVAPQLGVDDDLERLEDLVSGGHGSHCRRASVCVVKHHRRARRHGGG